MQNQGHSQGTPSPQAVPQDDHLGKVVCGHEAGFCWAVGLGAQGGPALATAADAPAQASDEPGLEKSSLLHCVKALGLPAACKGTTLNCTGVPGCGRALPS